MSMTILTYMYLFINSWTDLKERTINVLYTIVFLMILAVWQIKTGNHLEITGILPGIFLWISAKTGKAGIGEGDGIICMALGYVTGWRTILTIMLMGFTGSFMAGILCCFLGKNRELPFIPFLLAGYMIM